MCFKEELIDRNGGEDVVGVVKRQGCLVVVLVWDPEGNELADVEDDLGQGERVGVHFAEDGGQVEL